MNYTTNGHPANLPGLTTSRGIEGKEITTRVRQILTDLEGVREALLALSDDIWLSIDHNDTEALNEGVNFKVAYNEKMAAFNRQAYDLSALVQQYTQIPIETPSGAGTGRNGVAENQRMILELDRDTPHYLNEDFSYKRPYGFVLQGQAYKDIVTWLGVYKLVCTLLLNKDRARFTSLPDHEAFISRRGNKDFARNAEELRIPFEITNGMYMETNHSAKAITRRISELLNVFGIAEQAFVIYLREDRDAEDAVKPTGE